MHSLRTRLIAIAGAAMAAGLTASLFVSAPTPTTAQGNPPQQGGQRGAPKPEHGPMHHQQLHQRVAANLGVTPERLEQAFKQARKDMVMEMLQQGRITQEQADRMIARIDQGPRAQRGQNPAGQGQQGGQPRRGQGQPGAQGQPGTQGQPNARVQAPQRRAVQGVIAQALGMQPRELQDALRNGKSLTAIAAEKGITPDQLRTNVEGQLEQRINQAIQQGNMTQEQAQQIRTRHRQMMEQLLRGGPRRGPAPVQLPR